MKQFIKSFPAIGLRILLIALALISISSRCKKDGPISGPATCGGDKHWISKDMNMNEVSYTSEVDGIRTFIFKAPAVPEDVCPSGTAKTRYYANVANMAGASWTGRLLWSGGAFNESEMPFTVNGYYDGGSDSFKLAGATQTEPLKPELEMLVKFPTKGSEDEDKAFLAGNMWFLRAEIWYKAYKK